MTITTPGELFGLSDKVAVVTGASSGLGARWAAVLAGAGARVVVTARREKELREVAAGVRDALVLPGDLTDDDHRRRVV